MLKNLLIIVAALGISVAGGCGGDGDMTADMAATMGQPDSGAGGAGGDTALGSGGALGTGGMLASDAGSVDTGGAIDAIKSTGGTSGSGGTKVDAGGSGGMTGTGGARVDAGSAGGTGGAPAAEPLFCPQTTEGSPAGCGFLLTTGVWEFLWKNGHACGQCTLAKKQVSGCKVHQTPDMTSNPTPQPTELLCVTDCRAECCSMRAGSSCTSDAGCCGTLRCKDAGAGKGKSCQ